MKPVQQAFICLQGHIGAVQAAPIELFVNEGLLLLLSVLNHAVLQVQLLCLMSL